MGRRLCRPKIPRNGCFISKRNVGAEAGHTNNEINDLANVGDGVSAVQKIIAKDTTQDSNMIPDRKNHHLPLETYSSTDCKFFITICTYNKNDLFTNHDLCIAVIDALLWYHNNHTWNLYCYCLMPNHLHMIVSLSPKSTQSDINAKSILTCIAQFKSYATRQLWKLSETRTLWQRNCFDSIIDQLDPVDDLIRYVINNPVRKGIVDNWEDYPYSGMISQF